MSERTRRLFFALWPDEELRRQIEAVTRTSVHESGGRPIPAANFHITLAFLGQVAESRIDELQQCALATPVDTFDLEFGEIQVWKRQSILCLEPITGQNELNHWVERLQKSLAASGFKIERRAFRGHITLCRDIKHEIAAPPPIRALTWRARGMELIESTIGDSGSSYRVIE